MMGDNLCFLAKTTEFRLKLYPKDFSKVKDFYENTLGYPIVNSWNDPGSHGAMFDTGKGIIELLTPKIGYLPVQGVDVSLQIKNVWELWEKLKDHPNIIQPLKIRPWGDVSFCITDPEGFRIIFFTSDKLNQNKA